MNAADRLEELREELDEWAEGRRSHWNTYLAGDPERRTEQMAHCAIADAHEVVKLSAAIQAYVALMSIPAPLSIAAAQVEATS